MGRVDEAGTGADAPSAASAGPDGEPGSDAAMWTLIAECDPERQQPQALQALVEAALAEPRRALRMVAPHAADRTRSGEVLRRVLLPLLRRHGALVDALLPTLDPSARRAIEAVRRELGDAVLEARPEDLPEVLRAPPWQRRQERAKAVRLDAVRVTAPPDAMSWLPGERERNAVKPPFALPNATRRHHSEVLGTAMLATLSRAEFDQLERWAVHGTSYLDVHWLDYLVAQRELAALPYLWRMFGAMPGDVIASLLPYGATRFAPGMAELYREKKSLRLAARAWLLRHPAHAAAGLIGATLGPAGKPRLQAELALRLLAKNGHEATLLALAETALVPLQVRTRKGSAPALDVAGAIAALLAFDPLDEYPTRLATLPPYADARLLPAPELTGRRGALPVEAVQALLQMLAFSRSDEPYAGLALVTAACEPRSLARFAWELFTSWLAYGAPPKDAWCMQALGVFGDDAAARKLAALVREWPGESANARAVLGLEVLARIGSDVALMHLNIIALKVKFRALQSRANEKIEDIAESRGLTREELEDRLAPDLGLDPDGSMRLDFGSRTFTVGFDEQLRPFVKDALGSRLKELPKPAKADDATRAKAAGERWSLLKKDARTSAGLQVGRLEQAMCTRRRFTAADFVQLFVRHPLLFHIVRRLVWATFEVPAPMGPLADAIVAAFRVAEDRTFASVEDDGWTLLEGSFVGLPHPLELGPEREAAWARVFADYELTQPFMQLGRPTFEIREDEIDETSLRRMRGVIVPVTRVMALAQRGWRRPSTDVGGLNSWLEKPLPGGRIMVMQLEPGFILTAPAAAPEQRVVSVSVYDGGTWWAAEPLLLSALDPLEFSELVRDLESLRS